jgi:magnesium transporter
MTPEYIYLAEDLTVAEAADKVRELARDREVSYYLLPQWWIFSGLWST